MFWSPWEKPPDGAGIAADILLDDGVFERGQRTGIFGDESREIGVISARGSSYEYEVLLHSADEFGCHASS